MDIKGGVSLEMLEMSVKNEPKSKKAAVLIGSIIHMAAGLIIGSIYLSWYRNQSEIQSAWN